MPSFSLPSIKSAVVAGVAALTLGLLVAPATPAQAATPGDITGYGFDQCLAPGQATMDRWMQSSPFLAVGIYISGDSRGCRSQPNLTPTWISTQLAAGWRLLPITLGPQASCLSSFPRYGTDATINPAAGAGDYAAAKAQGVAEAAKTVGVAQGLGLPGGTTLWYDLEGFDATNTACRESALSFLGGWTEQVRALGYVSGVYSSAGSGIQELDRARQTRPTRFTLPDRIWIARWDGQANTSTTYIPEDGWRPGGRIKQYQGGHDENWGGVTINIDSNYLELGRAPVPSSKTQCGTQVEFAQYAGLRPAANGKKSGAGQVRALQCLLKKKGVYAGKITGRYSPAVVKAVRAWQAKVGLPSTASWSRKAWQTLHASGNQPVLKIGSTGMPVRRVQRALNAKPGTNGPVDGVYGAATQAAVRTWQAKVGVEASGVFGTDDWASLVAGRR
jgi:hypothetical protein